MEVKINKKPKFVFEMEVTIPNSEVKKEYKSVLEQLSKVAEMPGFRRGQVPQEMVEEKADKSKLYGDLINNLLQKYYPQALKEHKILPIANPNVEIQDFDIDKDFSFTATIATKPDVKVGEYKDKIKKSFETRKASSRKENAEKLAKGEQIDSVEEKLTVDDVVNGIIAAAEIELSEIVIHEEIHRMMDRFDQQLQGMGLNLDRYLESIKKTVEELHSEYEKIAERNIRAELALAELIKAQNVDVSDAEVDEMVNASGDDKTREMLNNPTERLYIKLILQKNKLISDILRELGGVDADEADVHEHDHNHGHDHAHGHDHEHNHTHGDEHDHEKDAKKAKSKNSSARQKKAKK